MSSDLTPFAPRDATINLRLPGAWRDQIDQAAAAVGKTRTEFMVEAARREAEGVLLERCYFPLGDKSFVDFLAALDQPPSSNPKLARLMKRAAPWEE
jgi:uncharacterized protein (DUF1778 family)